jgi:hydroxymethylglutaryl-CoA lyase
VARRGKKILKEIPKAKVAMHFHDTRGMALANICASIDLGITKFDASVGGLGGCPYAAGASGNVATEDVVNMLHEMGHKTDLDLKKLQKIAKGLEKSLGRSLPSKLAKIKL